MFTQSNTKTRSPTAVPTVPTIVYDRGYSDLTASQSGGVIGAVAAFGFCVLAIIGFMLYKGYDGHDKTYDLPHGDNVEGTVEGGPAEESAATGEPNRA